MDPLACPAVDRLVGDAATGDAEVVAAEEEPPARTVETVMGVVMATVELVTF